MVVFRFPEFKLDANYLVANKLYSLHAHLGRLRRGRGCVLLCLQCAPCVENVIEKFFENVSDVRTAVVLEDPAFKMVRHVLSLDDPYEILGLARPS